MKVSLYIPVYNGAKYIEAVLTAVLNQTKKFDEIIVVDDASSDNTVEIVKNYPIKLIVNTVNNGLAYCRNIGIKNAVNDYVASVDADVVIDEYWLSLLSPFLKDNNIAGVSGKLIESNVESIYDKWRKENLSQHFGDIMHEVEFLAGSNTIFKKSILLDIGLYNEKFRRNHEDTDISRRIKAQGYTLLYIPQAKVYHIKKDNFNSVMKSCFGFRYKACPHNIFHLFFLCIREIYHSCYMFFRDIAKGKYELLTTDIKYAFIQIYFLCKSYKNKNMDI